MGNIHIMTTKALISGFTTVTLCLLFLSSSYAGVYKWVDENGQVNYGERPVGTGAEQIIIRKNETTQPREIKKAEGAEQENTSDNADGKVPDGESTEKAGAEPAKAEEEEISRKEKRRLCNEAKSDIASISSRGRMREVTAKGEYIYLTEEQRQQRLSAARKKQRDYCR